MSSAIRGPDDIVVLGLDVVLDASDPLPLPNPQPPTSSKTKTVLVKNLCSYALLTGAVCNYFLM